MERYIILRDLSRHSRGKGGSPDVFSPDTKTKSFSARDLPIPEIQSAELNPYAVEDLRADPDVKDFAIVMPTMLLAPVARGEDGRAAGAGDSWGIAAVGANTATVTGKSVSVCVLDTGIDGAHAAFQGLTLTKKDFTKNDQLAANLPEWDGNGHGTHCAGTIFGRDVNGARIGIARDVTTALIGKVLDDEGRGTTEMLFNGLQWAIGEGVDVVSMSIGFDFPGLVERRVAAGWSARQAASDALVAYRANLRLFDSLMGMVKARAAFNEGTVIVAASGKLTSFGNSLRELGVGKVRRNGCYHYTDIALQRQPSMTQTEEPDAPHIKLVHETDMPDPDEFADGAGMDGTDDRTAARVSALKSILIDGEDVKRIEWHIKRQWPRLKDTAADIVASAQRTAEKWKPGAQRELRGTTEINCRSGLIAASMNRLMQRMTISWTGQGWLHIHRMGKAEDYHQVRGLL